MKRAFNFMLGFGIVVAFLAFVVNSSLAQFPDPKDEAKLYELAKKEGTLVWYVSSPLDLTRILAKDFETKYPGIKVEILRIVGVAQYQRFLHETNARQYIVDILHLSDYPSMTSLIQKGHIVEWKVPTSEQIPSPFRMGNYSYASYVTNIGIAYNVNKVTPEEVKILGSSWKGVLDARFKGRFAVISQKCGSCYGPLHMFLDPKNTKVFGPEFIKAVAAQKPAVYPNGPTAVDRVVAGEHDFTYWSPESHASAKWEQGAPMRWVHPDPTPVYGNSWLGISKYAPHPNATRLFLNWLMSEAGALSHMDIGYQTSLEGVKDIRKFVNEPWYDPIKHVYNVDWERWEKNYNKDMNFWMKAITEGR